MTDKGATAGFDYATPEPRERLISLAARMVRLEGGCEAGHKPGQWHMHEGPFHDLGRQAASIAHALPATPASPPPPSEPCSGCGGRRWSNDENWQPTFPETWRGERSHGDGLIPCGFCNEAGWDTPDWAPDDDREPTADPIPDSAEQSAPAGSRLPPGTDPGTEPNA
jgi:hypothetical protein